MRAKTKKRDKGIRLAAMSAGLIILGAGLPLLFMYSGWGVPRITDGVLELAGASGLGVIFLELRAQR